MNDIVPRSTLARQGVQGVISIAGGIGSFILAGITGHPIIGILVGGALTVCGLALSGSKKDRAPGIITTVAGVATLAASIPVISGIFGGLVHGTLIGAGVVLLGVGAWSLFKFIRGLKTRT
jgi:hypothetical protein